MSNNSQLAIILPVFNPPARWDKLVLERYTEIKNSLPHKNVSITIVNDGSTSALYQNGINNLSLTIRDLSIINNKVNKGKGNALRTGVAATVAGFYILTDIDFPYTNESMLAVYEGEKKGADVAMGTRDHLYYKNVSWYRAALSKMLRFFIRNLLKIPFDDTQCGLKGFNEKGKAVFLQTTINRYLFDLEFTMLAARNKNIKLVPLPVELRAGIRLSKMPLKILLQEAVNFIKLLFRKANG
ncbi:MAG: glycosyltransferase family 2 protein [Sphingobacteriales bacterium]|nr:glycosyltransferase family 2 protein [Sphingobacteriales bacterium]